MHVREATAEELAGWDARTVDVPGGDVYQSLAWAEQRSRVGWQPHFLAFDDGFRLLALTRPWRLIGGAGAYLSRGPITRGEPVAKAAERLIAAADYLAAHGVDVIASDAEIEAASGYAGLIERAGFRPIEEVQPSRHRLSLSLAPGVEEEAVSRAFSDSIRQRVRGAERAGFRVLRWDARAGDSGPGFEIQPSGGSPQAGKPPSDPRTAPVFERFYDLLRTAADRRGFVLGSRSSFVDWSMTGLAAGHVIYLEVRSVDDVFLGGATFYRHGSRITYSLSADRADLRRSHPGVVPFVLWRAIQIAIREERTEMDLAGVDVAGARRLPVEGEEMFGLYQFKRMFGAHWVEIAGNHERVVRPARYLLGRLTGRLPLGR